MPNAITGSPYELSRTELFLGNYIAGQWEDQEEGRLICRNPSNNEILAELPNSGRDAGRALFWR